MNKAKVLLFRFFYYSSGKGDEDVDPIASCDSKLFTCATSDAFLFSKAKHLFLNRVTYENENVYLVMHSITFL